MASNPAMIIRVAATLAELKANLAEGKSQIETTTAAMGKLAASFSGDKLIQAAHNVTAAVNQIGGVSKLTDAEMARVNNTIERALEKYRALGREAPAGMQALADATKGATTAGEGWSSWLGKATGLLSAFGVGVGVASLVSFGKGLIDSAGALVDLSAKTGASIEQLQRWEFVGRQAGVSTDQFADASFKLGVKLAGGTGSVRDAVEKLGLSYATLKTQSPDAQFNATIQALEAMIDPQERNRLAVELFGKSWASIAPAVAAGYTEMAAQAKVSSDAQIKAIDNASDAWDRWLARQKASLTSGLGNWVIAQEQLGKLNDAQLETYRAMVARLDFAAAQTFLLDLAKQVDIVLPPMKAVAAATTDYTIELVKAMVEVNHMTRSQIAGVEAAQRLGKSVDEIVAAYGISEGAIKVITERTQARTKATEADAAATKKVAEVEAAALLGVTRLWDEYFALRTSHGGTATAIAIAQIQRWADDTEAAAEKAGTATSAFYAALAADSHEKMASVGIDWDLWRTKSIPAMQEAAENARRTYHEMVSSGLFFREDLEQQRLKYIELEDAARGYGDEAKAAQEKAAAAAKKHTDELVEQVKQAALARAAMMAMGGSSELRSLSTKEFTEAGGLNRISMLAEYTTQSYGPSWEGYLAKQRDLVLLAELKKYAESHGLHLPGFASGVENFPGGWGMVGERGPEAMYVPPHASIYPSGSGAGGSVTNIYITQPLGTPSQIARAVDDALMQHSRDRGARW